jgi:hypothetical protein
LPPRRFRDPRGASKMKAKARADQPPRPLGRGILEFYRRAPVV